MRYLKMALTDNLRRAKTARNDEFYTRLEDIEYEILNRPDYKRELKGKVVYCNCDRFDSRLRSNFIVFFKEHFESLGIKKLISTYFTEDEVFEKREWRITNGVLKESIVSYSGDGDFRSDICKDIMKESDVIVTNPPFSLFRDFVAQMFSFDKKFLIIGSENAIIYKEIFPLLKDGKMFIGYTRPSVFYQPDGISKKFGNIIWYTNIDIDKVHEPLPLTKGFSSNYLRYDNYNAIEVSKLSDIPKDYSGIMGVPITYMERHCVEQFEIVGSSNYEDTPCRIDKNYRELGYKFYKADGITPSTSGALRDRCSPKVYDKGVNDFSVSPTGVVLSAKYNRIFIKKRDNDGNSKSYKYR